MAKIRDDRQWVSARVLGLAALLFVYGCSSESPVAPSPTEPAPPVSSGGAASSEPTACFTTEPNPPEIMEGQVIVLDAGCSTGVSSEATYQWQLGDGRTRTGPRLRVQYRSPGDYVVELRVEDHGMTSTATKELRVHAKLTACFTYQHLSLAEEMLPCSVFFNASCSEGPIREYLWFFQGSPDVPDDDETVSSAGPEVEHTWSGSMECRFFRPFERLVRLTVVGSDGKTETTEQTVAFTNILKSVKTEDAR